MRGRLYSSWASSTWSLPSAERACWAKMSRISWVRSTTRVLRASSSARCCGRIELVVDEQHLRLRVRVGLLELLELALADIGARVGALAVLDDLGDRLDAGGARELLQLGELLLGVDPLGEHRDGEPTLGSRPGRGIGLASSHRGIMPLLGGRFRASVHAPTRRGAARLVPPTSPMGSPVTPESTVARRLRRNCTDSATPAR